MIHLRLIRLLRASVGLTVADIARTLRIPAPSVRRLIGECRRYALPIATSAQGFYTLRGE